MSTQKTLSEFSYYFFWCLMIIQIVFYLICLPLQYERINFRIHLISGLLMYLQCDLICEYFQTFPTFQNTSILLS